MVYHSMKKIRSNEVLEGFYKVILPCMLAKYPPIQEKKNITQHRPSPFSDLLFRNNLIQFQLWYTPKALLQAPVLLYYYTETQLHPILETNIASHQRVPITDLCIEIAYFIKIYYLVVCRLV